MKKSKGPCSADANAARFRGKSWLVFGPLRQDENVDLSRWKSVPARVEAHGRTLPKTALKSYGRVDLALLTGGLAEGKAALVFIPFETKGAETVSIGIGADWWFEAFIDGVPFMDTIATGNGTSEISAGDHCKDLELSAGTHLLALRVISGSAGFALAVTVGEIWGVDFGVRKGKIKPLHGVNNGPLTYGSLIDVSDSYRALEIPWVRIHDSNWPHPREVDIPQIFRNPDADPADPGNYDFSRTDAYIKSILDAGAKIIYRLGTSIEHTQVKYYVHPPKDNARWAKVCLGIIKHYNEGWANGFHYGIKYWEIWNEPDGPQMWTGSQEQYFALYETASKAIKEFDPALKVGGYAVAYTRRGMLHEFLDFCKTKKLPLDFLSWHIYAPSPKVLETEAKFIRSLLDERGFAKAESVLDEWNLSLGVDWSRRCNAFLMRAGFERVKNESGASFSASSLIRMQDAGVDIAAYYDAQPSSLFCGLFDSYGVPQKTFKAFMAFKRLLSYPERVGARVAGDIDCLAAIDRKRDAAAVLLSKFGGAAVSKRELPLRNLPKRIDRYEIFMLDRDLDFESVKTGELGAGMNRSLPIEMRSDSVALVLFSPGMPRRARE